MGRGIHRATTDRFGQDTSVKLFRLRGTIVGPEVGAVNGVGVNFYYQPGKCDPVPYFSALLKLTVVFPQIFAHPEASATPQRLARLLDFEKDV